MKQTYLHKGGLKPGTYFLLGENNKVKNGNLMFDRIIGDFLVAKGLATTEDNCLFVPACCSDFTLEYDDETGQLCLTLGGEQQCVTIESGGGSVEVNNALTGTGQAGDPVQWGGDLVKNTTVEGNDDYRVIFQNLTNFLTTVHGSSADATFSVSGFQSLPSTLRHIKKGDPNVISMINLDHDSVHGLEYQDLNGIIGFRIFPTEDDSDNNLALRTKAIRDGTASLNQVPILTDTNDGKFEWGNISGGSITYPGPYDQDSDAGVGGVAIGRAYELSAGNIYGMAEGVIKVRKT